MRWLIFIKLIMVIILWCIYQIIMLYPLKLSSAEYQLYLSKTGRKNHNTPPPTPRHWRYVEPILALFIMKMCGIICKLDLIRNHLNILSGLISLVSSSYWAVWREQIMMPVDVRYATGFIYTWGLTFWFMLTFTHHLLWVKTQLCIFPTSCWLPYFGSWHPQSC